MSYISSEKLKKFWEILDFDLLQNIRNGLPAYDGMGRKTILESQVKYEKEESIEELRTRIFLKESQYEQSKIEKNNSAEYAVNAQRLIESGLLGSRLPQPKMYDADKVRQRVEARIMEEYTLIPSFPVVPPGTRLIASDINEAALLTLLDEIKTFQFKIQEANEYAKLHGLKLIIETDEPAVDSAPKLNTSTPNRPDAWTRLK